MTSIAANSATNGVIKRARFNVCRRTLLLPLLFTVFSPHFFDTAQAMDSTEVLPESINSPSLRMGVVSGIGMKFMAGGDLMSLGETNSIEFDTRTLTQFEPRVNQLASVLNQFGNQRLGDALSLGVLHVETVPEVRYLAPVYARGLTTNWTVGFGVPILSYKNKLSLQQSGSNVAAIRAQFGNALPELNAAFDELDVPLSTRAAQVLAQKGYKPLVDRSETQVGDVQLVSLYQFSKRERTSAQLKTIISLPTGKGDDPDDLADLGAFGYSAIENQLVANYTLSSKWLFAGKAGFRYTLGDRVERRVPVDENDSLPAQDTKETVARQTGGALFGGVSATYTISSSWDCAAGYDITRKFSDRYDGTNGKRYDLLGSNTETTAERIRLALSYSSVETFFAGKAWLPSMISYEFSDTIRGVNTERMTVHEIWLQLFF